MSNIDKRALREAANAANTASWGNWEPYKPHKGARGYEVKVGFKAVAQHCLKVDSVFIAAANPATVLALLDELEAADKRIAELEELGRGVKQFSEFQICHYGATEDYAKGYIDCQSNYNKVLFAAAGKGEAL